MADLITLARAVPLKKSSGLVYYQLITDAVDASGYDSIDFQYTVTSDHADGVTVDILTSMQNKIDDIAAGTANPSWYSIGSTPVAAAAGVPAIKARSMPAGSTTAPLLRWIRYMITLGTNTQNATFTIEGLARRGLRVG